jgi:hypothetical protein
LHSLRDGKILVPLELALQRLDLGGREGGPRPLLAVVPAVPLLTCTSRERSVTAQNTQVKRDTENAVFMWRNFHES